MRKNNNKPKKGKGIIIKKIGGQWITNDTPSFEKLKQKGSESWEKTKKILIEQGEFTGIETTEQDIEKERLMWLGRELKKIKSRLSDTYPNGRKRRFTSDKSKIEIKKYQDHIEAEKLDLKKPASKGLPKLSYAEFGFLLNIISEVPKGNNCPKLCKKYGVKHDLDLITRGYKKSLKMTVAGESRENGYKFRYYDNLIDNIFANGTEFQKKTKKLKKELEENINKANQKLNEYKMKKFLPPDTHN